MTELVRSEPPNTAMHQTGAFVSKEALFCARHTIELRFIIGAPHTESPAGDCHGR